MIRLARCSPFLTLVDFQEAGERHPIALYANALRENAAERYALFLGALRMTAIDHVSEGGASMHGHERECVSMGGDDMEEQRRALIRAREHGLDVDKEEPPPSLPELPTLKLAPVIPPTQPDSNLQLQSDTPGGMPIPIISTTEPETPFEPSSPFTPTYSRMPPPRSNSADFVSLSTLSLREVTRLETGNLSNASALAPTPSTLTTDPDS